ncbi:MAG TPA: hypothetical protein VFD90_03635 [Gaiellales bacterium]|nr:hypothetical protein [Gaiellales bacterium]
MRPSEAGFAIAQTTRISAGGAFDDCHVTLHLTDGTLALRGKIDFAKAVSMLQVTSGTGAYSGAKGSVIVRLASDTKSVFTIRLA